MNHPIRIAAVDDHPTILRGIAAALRDLAPELEVVAVEATVDALFAGAGATAEVVLLDLGLPGDATPEENIGRLIAAGKRVLIFTSEEKPVPLRRAIAAGAHGVLLKMATEEAIVDAIRASLSEEIVFSGPVAHALVTDPSLVSTLTPRQVEILELLSRGLQYKHVQTRLGIAEGTLREQLKRAGNRFRERGIEPGNTVGLVRYAASEGHLEL